MNEPVVTLQTQTLDNNCVSACLAMVLNRDIDEVTAEFHQAYHDDLMEPQDYLREAGIPFRHCMASERVLHPDHTYLVTVPSVTIKGGLHMIVIQALESGDWFIFDPNEGKEGRIVIGSYYGDAPEGCFQMIAYQPDFEFLSVDIIYYDLKRQGLVE